MPRKLLVLCLLLYVHYCESYCEPGLANCTRNLRRRSYTFHDVETAPYILVDGSSNTPLSRSQTQTKYKAVFDTYDKIDQQVSASNSRVKIVPVATSYQSVGQSYTPVHAQSDTVSDAYVNVNSDYSHSPVQAQPVSTSYGIVDTGTVHAYSPVEVHPVSSGYGNVDTVHYANDHVQDVDFVDANPHHEKEESLSIEGSGIKLAVVIVALWYLILAALVGSSDSLGSHCVYNGDGEVHYINAENFYLPHVGGESALQSKVYEMFTEHPSSSEEDMDVHGQGSIIEQVTRMCGKNAFFYGMNTQHMTAMGMVKEMFMGQPDPESMLTMAGSCRRALNSKMWYTALMSAAHDREDMSDMIMPGPLDAMPENFIHDVGFDRSLRRGRSHKKKDKKCIKVDSRVGYDNGPENLLWYFREDVMVNSHHWYWHLAYPLMSKRRLDRRGELFYYSHKSMIARYNIERLCNGLHPTIPIAYDEPLEEGYNAHLTDINAGMPWTDRPPQQIMTDIFQEGNPNNADRPVILIKDWLRARNRLIKAVDKGYFVAPLGKKIVGIDTLGNTLEAVDISVNPKYYDPDGYHNLGHRIIAYIVDPHFHQMLPPGVMGDPATAMRDPVFYRWHTNVNNIFERFKNKLYPYAPVGGHNQLLWPGVTIHEVSTVSKSGQRNYLHTFFGKRKFELSLGLAFNRTEDEDDENLNICAKHLDHEEFEYEIVISRGSCVKAKTATIRVFLAPKYDLHGKRLTIQQQRSLFVHLDLFNVDLPPGKTIITRSSLDSSLTIPWTESLAQIQQNGANQPNCGCGWPHHLLLPRGTHEGMPFDLFVMATEGDDFVHVHNKCSKAFLYCGTGGKYPDLRPMGYPFDRKIYNAPDCGWDFGSVWYKVCKIFSLKWIKPLYIEDYAKGIGNMGVGEILIKHV